MPDLDKSMPRLPSLNQNSGYSLSADYSPTNYGVGFINFWNLLGVLQKWWWLIAIVTTTFTAVSALTLVRLTPVYKASAILEVKQEERNILEVSQIDNVVADKEFLTTQIELLKSRSLAQDVILNLNLLKDLDFYDPKDVEWQNFSAERKLRSIEKNYRERLKVRPVGRSRLISVTFEHTNPQKAAQIANTVTETFIENSLSLKFDSTAYARKFLEDRLVSVKEDLGNAEREFVAYARKNDIISIQDGSGSDVIGTLDSDSLVKLNLELTQATSERMAAETDYYYALKADFASEIILNSSLNELKEERIQLKSEYIEKLAIFKPKFPDMIELENRIKLFDQSIEQQEREIITASVADKKALFDAAGKKEYDLQRRVESLKDTVLSIREQGIDYNILEREIETLRTQYEGLLSRLKEVSVSDDIGSNLIQIVDRAQTPIQPFKPRKLQLLVLAFLLSGGLGLGLSYLIEVVDDRIKNIEDIKTKLKNVVLGVIPEENNNSGLIDILANPQSGLSEAYASLRTNICYSGADGGPKVIQVTSTRSGEGKSTTSLALALRFSAVGHSVLIIDADMRIPTFKQDGGSSVGLSGLLTSKVDFNSNVVKSRFDNLDFIPAGEIVPNPSELLATSRFVELLSIAKENYDYVLVDSPPVLGLADAPLIGAKVEATILIVEANKLRTKYINNSIERLHSSGTKIIGAVLTKSTFQKSSYMAYYQYNYGKDDNVSNQSNRLFRDRDSLKKDNRLINLS